MTTPLPALLASPEGGRHDLFAPLDRLDELRKRLFASRMSTMFMAGEPARV